MGSRGINKVILVGNLGQDPDIKYLANGGAVANITVATSESWKDQQGAKQERTEWHRVVVFGKLAEIVGEYLKKGSQVYLEGKLQTRKWQDQSGQDKYSTEIVIDQMGKMQMLGGAQSNSNASGQGKQQHQAQGQQNPMPQTPRPQAQSGQSQGYQQSHRPAPQPQAQQQAPQQNFTPDLDEGWGEDVPF